MAMIAENDSGKLTFDSDELTIESITKDGDSDKPKVRLNSEITDSSYGGGGVSFDAKDGNVQRELGLIKGEQSDKVRGNRSSLQGMIQILINNGGPDDSNMVHCIDLYHNELYLYPDILASLRRQLNNTVTDRPYSLISPDGYWLVQMQNDGNLVKYHCPNGDGIADGSTGKLIG